MFSYVGAAAVGELSRGELSWGELSCGEPSQDELSQGELASAQGRAANPLQGLSPVTAARVPRYLQGGPGG